MQAKPEFGKNVRRGGEIFRAGATMISPNQQRVEHLLKQTLIRGGAENFRRDVK